MKIKSTYHGKEAVVAPFWPMTSRSTPHPDSKRRFLAVLPGCVSKNDTCVTSMMAVFSVNN